MTMIIQPISVSIIQVADRNEIPGPQPLNQNRVIAAVRQQMVAKGFTEAENADLLVNITRF